MDAVSSGGSEMLRMVQGMFLSSVAAIPRVVVFCGVGAENGSTAVCAAAGKTIAAHSARSVCLVDADLRSARLSTLLGIEASSVKAEELSVDDQCVPLGDHVWLARTGFLSDEGGALPATPELKQAFAALRDAFEFVLIDAPGADLSGDAALLGQVADGTVLVIDAEETRKIAARRVKESLDAANVRLLGTVLRNRTFPIPRALYERL